MRIYILSVLFPRDCGGVRTERIKHIRLLVSAVVCVLSSSRLLALFSQEAIGHQTVYMQVTLNSIDCVLGCRLHI